MSSDADGGQECHSKPRKQPRITRDRRSGGMRCLGSCGDQYIHSTSATLSPRLLRVTAEMHSSPHCRFNTQHSRMLPCRRLPGWGLPAGAERVMRTGAVQQSACCYACCARAAAAASASAAASISLADRLLAALLPDKMAPTHNLIRAAAIQSPQIRKFKSFCFSRHCFCKH